MNIAKLRLIIARYKAEFDRINELEIYKWVAVKCFQDHWDIEAKNFKEMLGKSFGQTGNLLVGSNYYPLKMLLHNIDVNDTEVRELFRHLYDEDISVIDRIETFMREIKKLNQRNYPNDLAYHFHRAVMVYLTLRYPNEYYLYKYGMFKEFTKLIDYPYKPKKGRPENIAHYLNLCEQVKNELEKDEVLLKLHMKRLTNNANTYSDNSLHLLVQDVIYAATFHFKDIALDSDLGSSPIISNDSNVNLVEPNQSNSFKGTIINHTSKQQRNKRIGELGELFVVQYEMNRISHLKNRVVEHVAITKGDGLGFDILSYNDKKKPVYIEVKTTTQSFNTPFYITRTELERSIKEGESYYLYRVYDFEPETSIGKIHIIRGSLEPFCKYPETYKIKLQ